MDVNALFEHVALGAAEFTEEFDLLRDRSLKHPEARAAFVQLFLDRYAILIRDGTPGLAALLELAFAAGLQHAVAEAFTATLEGADTAHPVAVTVAVQRVRWVEFRDDKLRSRALAVLADRFDRWRQDDVMHKGICGAFAFLADSEESAWLCGRIATGEFRTAVLTAMALGDLEASSKDLLAPGTASAYFQALKARWDVERASSIAGSSKTDAEWLIVALCALAPMDHFQWMIEVVTEAFARPHWTGDPGGATLGGRLLQLRWGQPFLEAVRAALGPDTASRYLKNLNRTRPHDA